MIRLNRLATTLRTLSTTVRTTPSLATTRRHSLIQTASFKTKISYNNNSWSTQSETTSTGKFYFIGQDVDEKDPFNYDDDKKLLECDNSKYVPNDVVLYQLEGCPLCNKVKVFLEYYGIPHKIMEVNPFYEREIKRSDFRKVPVLMVDGEKLVNASDIIDEMFKRMYPDSAPVDVVTQKWRRWADTTLLPVLLMNTYGSLSGALETYDYIWSYGCYNDAQRFLLKHCGAFYSYYLITKLKIRYYFRLTQKRKALNITNDREFLYKAAEEWVDALKG